MVETVGTYLRSNRMGLFNKESHINQGYEVFRNQARGITDSCVSSLLDRSVHRASNFKTFLFVPITARNDYEVIRARYDDESQQTYFYVPFHSDGSVQFHDPRDDSAYQASLDTLLEDLRDPQSQLRRVLTSSGLHELAHDAFNHSWNFKPVIEIAAQATAIAEQETDIDDQVATIVRECPSAVRRDGYRAAYDANRTLVETVLPFVPNRQRFQYLESSKLLALSEIVAYVVQFTKYWGLTLDRAEEKLLDVRYLTRTNLLLPEPEDYREIIETLGAVQLPLGRKDYAKIVNLERVVTQ